MRPSIKKRCIRFPTLHELRGGRIQAVISDRRMHSIIVHVRFINGLTPVEARATKWTAERRVSSFAGKPAWKPAAGFRASFLWRSGFNRIFLAVVTG